MISRGYQTSKSESVKLFTECHHTLIVSSVKSSQTNSESKMTPCQSRTVLNALDRIGCKDWDYMCVYDFTRVSKITIVICLVTIVFLKLQVCFTIVFYENNCILQLSFYGDNCTLRLYFTKTIVIYNCHFALRL